MMIAIESRRKKRALILWKITIPRPTPISNAGERDTALIIIFTSIRPDTARAMSEQEHANKKYTARLQ